MTSISFHETSLLLDVFPVLKLPIDFQAINPHGLFSILNNSFNQQFVRPTLGFDLFKANDMNALKSIRHLTYKPVISPVSRMSRRYKGRSATTEVGLFHRNVRDNLANSEDRLISINRTLRAMRDCHNLDYSPINRQASARSISHSIESPGRLFVQVFLWALFQSFSSVFSRHSCTSK